MISIIIPAHNEAAVILSCLKPFKAVNGKSDIEVIVVCNGCTDDTAGVVSKFNKDFICIETKNASKTNALNLGDKKAKYYPRIYLDADVVLSIDAVYAMRDFLNETGLLATSVEARMGVANSSWCVRAFYDVWFALPYFTMGMIGTGVYVLSKEGRDRFDEFPCIIADDSYIRCLFTENERATTKGYFSIVTAPKNLKNLIKIKTRSRYGRYQLIKEYPELILNEYKDYSGAMKKLVCNWRFLPKLIVYVGVNLISRFRARYQYITKQTKWERDESSRA